MKQDEVSLHRRLKEMLVDEARAGRKVLIFIDEAQNLQQSSLEAIRLLSDFETARAKLLHIILSGSARLGRMLLTPELSQLAQRISTVCRLES
jgi:type II secretory pathway predicted ATPase ExeA